MRRERCEKEGVDPLWDVQIRPSRRISSSAPVRREWLPPPRCSSADSRVLLLDAGGTLDPEAAALRERLGAVEPADWSKADRVRMGAARRTEHNRFDAPVRL